MLARCFPYLERENGGDRAVFSEERCDRGGTRVAVGASCAGWPGRAGRLGCCGGVRYVRSPAYSSSAVPMHEALDRVPTLPVSRGSPRAEAHPQAGRVHRR